MMIEINLLPEELRHKFGKGFNIDTGHVFYFAALIFIILICAHICLAVVNFTKSIKSSALNRRWRSLESERRILDNFKKEYDVLASDAKVIQQLAGQKINWAKNLNRLSLDLPAGIWFNELFLRQKDFTLKGSVISKEKEEFALINKFIDNLEQDKDLFKDFNSLELSSVQKRTLGGYEVVDFILTGKLK